MKSRAKKLSAPATFAIAALTVLGGCNTSGCLDNRSSLPLAGFYSYATFRAITLSSIDIQGIDAPDENYLLENGQSASEVYLPFRSTQKSTSFVIHYNDEGIDSKEFNDTIDFAYTSTPYFVSEECGAMMRYRITKVKHTRHLLDSIGVIPSDSVIDNINTQNLKLFFRTEE